MNLIYSLFLFVIFFSTETFAKKDRIRLREVGALTFNQNEFTRSRKSNPIPQLRCIGGTARCEITPKVVQCFNTGFDGIDVQWQCKADLEKKYSFGKIFVNCEGYDYPDDDYVVAGSCGLEYELDYSGNRDKKWSKSFSETNQDSPNNLFGFGFILFALCAIALIYFCLPKSGQGSRPEPSAPPPPPGFHTGFFDDTYSSSGCGTERFSRPTSSSTTSNLWSGAIGAGLGYMLGRNSNSNSYTNTEQRRSYNRDNYGNDSSEEVRSATGFGTTKRR